MFIKSIHQKNITNIKNLRPGKSNFNKTRFDQIKTMLTQQNGSALDIVHPDLCNNYYRHPKKYYVNKLNEAGITEAFYKPFKNRFNNYIDKYNGPIFVFSCNKRNTYNWIKSLNNKNPFVIIDTTIDAIPLLSKKEGKSWEIISYVMKEMGIKSHNVIGELLFRVNNKEIGCVLTIKKKLSNYFPVNINYDYTFPNCKMPLSFFYNN